MGNLLLDSILNKYKVYHSFSAWHEWELIDQQKQSPHCKIVRNKRNSSLIGQMKISKEVNNLQNLLAISQFRFDFITEHIVGIHGIYSSTLNNFSQINFCSRNQSYAQVTEHMKYSFADMGQISFRKFIFILKSALKGAKLIMQQLKILPIYDQNMIFLNSQDNYKVWINSDLTANFSAYKHLPIKQFDTVHSIFITVEQKTQNSSEFANFLTRKSSIQISSFRSAIDFVNQFDCQPTYLVICLHPFEKQIFQHRTTHNAGHFDKSREPKKCYKKSLSVKKVKTQTEACVFFSARKKKNREEEDDENNKVIKKFFFYQNDLRPVLSAHEFHRYHKANVQYSEQTKKTSLKKRILKKNQIKEKFIDSRVKESKINSKPLSTLSTQYDSTENSSAFPSRMQPEFCGQELQPIKFTKKKEKMAKDSNMQQNSIKIRQKNWNYQMQKGLFDGKNGEDQNANQIKRYKSEQNIDNGSEGRRVPRASWALRTKNQSSVSIFSKAGPFAWA